ncbi:hypothetical protein, partial [Bordetella pertussis]|uniref:hypothetical protein n=1 Tax=Bordetella pertussis TaxID=520 RepID=UPI0021CC2722
KSGSDEPCIQPIESSQLAGWLDAGVAGFRCTAPQRLDASDWRALFEPLRASRPGGRPTPRGWTPNRSACAR